MKKNNKLVMLLLIGVAFLVLLISSNIFKSVETKDFTAHLTGNTPETTGEIVTGSIIRQQFQRVYETMDGLSLQFANYSGRPNSGEINVRVYNESTQIADVVVEASAIGDGEFIDIPFEKKDGRVGSNMTVEITSSNGQAGSAVTLWMTENNMLDNLGARLTINGTETTKSLHFKLDYISPKINPVFWFMLLFLLWLTIPTRLFGKFANKYIIERKFHDKVNSVLYSTGLIVAGFILLGLRDLSFLTQPTLYAEDASYLSNVFQHGFLDSVFMTRMGGGADFQNSGSYVLLYVALRTTYLFCGYDISSLPTFIGVYSNLFWSLVAFSAYKVFRPKGRMIGIVAFLTVILISLGSSGGEVLGRVLNTVFIWPLLISMLLILQYRNRYKFGVYSISIGLICILAGLSFPISYGVVGIYLIFSFIRLIKDKSLVRWFASDWLLMICIAIGAVLFPTIIKAKGITASLNLNPNSIFEFIIGRHILYPFIELFYTHLNDKKTAVLFCIYAGIIIYAGFLNFKKKKLFNSYTLFVCLTAGVSFSSAIMRIKMTAFFSEYQWTYPDRYFYGCNALCVLVLLYALHIIFTEKEINKHITSGVISAFLLLLLANPYLFEFTSPAFSVYGTEDLGTFKECIVRAIDEGITTETPGYVHVSVYPVFADGAWGINIPISHVLATLK